jgi:hypothetical protein
MRQSQARRTNSGFGRKLRTKYFSGFILLMIVALTVASASVLSRASGASEKTLRTNPRIASTAPRAVAGAGAFKSAPAPFAAITVDRTDDVAVASACTAAPTDCSLRGAVTFANLNPGTSIIVPAGTYNLSIPGGFPEGFSGNNSIGDLDVTASGTTISGAGAATTIIRQSQPNDRVIEINPFLDAGFTFSVSDVTITNGHETTAVGGGGMIAGSQNNVTTITNCIFSGNSATGAGTFGGGGISYTGGDLNVSGTTFSGNSTSASGGGIGYSAGDPLGRTPSAGVMTISGSSFTSNTAASSSAGGGALDLFDFNLSTGTYNVNTTSFSGNSASPGNGGAIIVESGGPLTVTRSSFTSNSAGNFGGAILTGGSTASIKFSRLVGNTVPIPTRGLSIYNSGLTTDANDDWWGVNTGPSANSAIGTLPIVTWLQLQNIANPNTVCSGGTSTLTADIKRRNIGPDLTVELNGLPPFPVPPAPVFGNAVLGTLSAISTQYVNGSATATYTAGATPGTGSADAFADNQSATANIIIQNTTATTPADQTVCQGTNATFSTTAGGTGPFHYAWTLDGSSFDGDNASITVPTGSLSFGAHPVTVTVTGACGSETESATLTVQSPTTTSTPADQTICEGGSATFSTTAGGTGPFSYAWTVDGSPFGGNTSSITVSGASAGSHAISVTTTGACGSASASATLTVQPTTTATALADQTICEGGSATFSTTAGGTGPFTYAWTVDGSPFGGNTPSITVSGAAPGSHPITVTVTGTCGSVTRNATLTVQDTTTATTPADQTICEGASATFSTTAGGTGPFTYAWTVDGSPAGNTPSITVSGASVGTHAIAVTVSGTCGSVTKNATLTVQPTTTATAPADQTVCEGSSATFSTTAGGTGPFTYAWTVDGSPAGNTPSITVSGATVGSHAIAVTVSGTCGSVTRNATLTVQPSTDATTPANQTVCQGGTVTFSTTASGTGPFTYQWRLDGNNIAGATSSSVVINTTGLSAGNHTVDVIVNGHCGSVIRSATLTVNTSPVVTLNPMSQSATSGTVTFTAAASGSPAPTVQWQVSTNGGVSFSDIPGETSTSLTVTVTPAANGNQYRAVFTNVCGSATTSAATLTTCSPPVITLSHSTLSMWPPNHSYHTFQVTDFVASATSNCYGNITSSVVITKVTSDEIENGNGDGNTLNDIVIAANCKSVQLRSERDGGGDGRVYTIFFKVTDASGNVTTATATVTVPKSQNGAAAVDSGPHYTVNSTCP